MIYSFIESIDEVSTLKQRINNNSSKSIICEMTYISQNILNWNSEILDNNIFVPKVKHDCIFNNYSSFLEDRILNPLDEHLKYIAYKEKHKQELPILICHKFPDNFEFENKSIFESIILGPFDESNRYSGEFGFKNKCEYPKEFYFSCGWNKKYMFFYTVVHDSKRNFSLYDEYDSSSNLILFCFNDDWDGKIAIHLKENGNHKVFLDSSNINMIKELNNIKLNVDVTNETYSLSVAIPWDDVEIKVEKGAILDFYFLIHTGLITELGVDALTPIQYSRKMILK